MQKPNSLESDLGGIVVRRQAHNAKVVGSKPALAIFEDSIVGQDFKTSGASSPPRSINGYLVRSYERRLWVHPAICC